MPILRHLRCFLGQFRIFNIRFKNAENSKKRVKNVYKNSPEKWGCFATLMQCTIMKFIHLHIQLGLRAVVVT